jgi:hypothetical protein
MGHGAFWLVRGSRYSTRRATKKYCAVEEENYLETVVTCANPEISCTCPGILHEAQGAKYFGRAEETPENRGKVN